MENENFLAERKPEPSSRSQTLIYHDDHKGWWIKVTLIGSVSDTGVNGTKSQQKIPKRERRREFQDFVKMINYKSLPLLDDTVTEVLLEQVTGISGTLDMNNSAEGASNRIVNLAGNLRYCIREHPERVFYPLCNEFPSFRQIDASEITEEAEIKGGIFHVSHNQRPYILKVVNRPLYRPRDTDVIRKELESLACFHNVPNIVHAAGVAVSDNTYKTSKTSNVPPVVIGILLEAHSGGSLQQAFAERRTGMYPWRQWPIQIDSALSHFHEAGWTHMDIKPSNVVRDAEGNFILIDISGIGGITHAWRAPEIREETSPLELPFKARRPNDAWAYGKLLSELASQIGENYSVWFNARRSRNTHQLIGGGPAVESHRPVS